MGASERARKGGIEGVGWKRRNKKMMKENKSHKCYKCNISLKISIKFPKTFVKHFTAPMIPAASSLQSDTQSEYQTHTHTSRDRYKK